MTSTTVTTKTFKLCEIGQSGPFGAFRVVVDESTQTVWYMGDEGEIMTHRLDADEIASYRASGTIALNSGNSDTWDEGINWFKAFDSDNLDKGVRIYTIAMYLRKVGESGETGPYARKMYEHYQNGLITLDELATYLVV
jgi:hypothetical protein